MNEISFSESTNILIEQFDMLTASAPFYHVDRTAGMNVMIYVTAGCIYVTEDGIDYSVEEGELLFLKKGTHQYGKRRIGVGTSWIYAHFQLDDKDENAPSLTLPKLVKLSEISSFEMKLKNICEHFNSDTLTGRCRGRLMFGEILLDIYAMTQSKETLGIENRIDQFISDNLHCNINSKQLSEQFHLTYKYLNRLYARAYGQSIMHIHCTRRMKLAAEELRMTDKSISLISEEAGFADSLYFSKCFKKFMGMSPREYRRNVMQKY